MMKPMTSTTGSSPDHEREPDIQMPRKGVSDGQSVPAGVRVAAAWSWRIIVIIAGIYVLGRLLGSVTTVLIPVLLAALVASLIAPLSQALRRLRFPGILASLSSIVILILVVFGLLALAGQQIISGFSKLSDSAMAGVNALIGLIEDLPIDVSTDRLNDLVEQGMGWLQDNSGSILSGAVSFGSTAGNFVTGFFIMIFTLIFFLSDGERIWLFIVKLFPKPAQAAVNGSGRKAWISLGQYVRVQGFVAFIDAVGIGLGAFILGVPLAVPLAILVFIGSWIPLVGAVVTGAIGVLVALVANGPMAALGMLAVVIIVQQLEGNVLQPLIMGQAVFPAPAGGLPGRGLGIRGRGHPGRAVRGAAAGHGQLRDPLSLQQGMGARPGHRLAALSVSVGDTPKGQGQGAHPRGGAPAVPPLQPHPPQ